MEMILVQNVIKAKNNSGANFDDDHHHDHDGHDDADDNIIWAVTLWQWGGKKMLCWRIQLGLLPQIYDGYQ